MIESVPLLDLLSIMFFPWAIVLSFFILYICIIFYNKYIQPPTELALETHQNSHPSLPPLPLPQPLPQQDIETGHLAPLQSQLEYKTGYI